MMRWAILGSTSFSGSRLVDYLLQRDEKLITISRPEYDLNKHMADIGALLDDYAPDVIVNFAAMSMVAESWGSPGAWAQTNVVALSELAAHLVKHGRYLKRFIQISTPEVYGATQEYLKEGAPFNPTTPYAVTRAAGDMMLRVMHKEYGFPVLFTRSVNVYGCEQPLYRIIPKTVMSILKGQKLTLDGGGASTRSFIHIDDVCDSICRLALDGKAGQDYHTSTNVQTSIRELVAMICRQMDTPFESVVTLGPERPGKDMAYQLDSDKIRTQLGWKDTIPLAYGVNQVVNWCTAQFAVLRDKPMTYAVKF